VRVRDDGGQSGHGLKLDEFAVRRKVEWALKHPKWGYFADTYIANYLHTAHQVVTRIRAQIAPGCDLLDTPPDGIDGMSHKVKVQ
jgi:hypothetical protein